MKLKTTANRLLALFLLLTMVLGIFPAPAMATQAPAEEKPATKAGKDYTSTINALEKPAAAYSKYQPVIEETYSSGLKGTVPVDDYVMVVNYNGNVYAFNPMRNYERLSSTVVAEPITIDGDYLIFSNNSTAQNCTVTLKANTTANYAYERLMVRRDGKAIEPIPYNGQPVFRVDAANNQTYAFYYDPADPAGITPFKYLTINNVRDVYTIVYLNGSFSLQLLSAYPRLQANNTFYFYRMASITDNLYNALQNAKTYATGNGNGTYDPELYAGFITLLEECIQVYGESNHYLSKAELADVVALQESLDTRANSLNAYMQVLAVAGKTPNYTTVLSKIPTSRGWDNHVVDTTDKTDFRGWNGTYFIVGTSHLMDPTATPSVDGHIAAVPVTVENKRVTNASLSQAIDLVYEETADGSDSKCYFFRAQNGNYLRAEIVDGNPTLSWGHAHQPLGMSYIMDTGDHERVFFSRNVNYDLNGNYLGTNNTRLNYDKTNISFALKNAGDGNSNYRLYRLTWSTEDLLAAIKEMIPYTNSKGSSIVSGVYQNFLTCLDESIALYLKYNVAHTPEQLEQTTAVQAELKAQVTRLLSYKSLLSAKNYGEVIAALPTPYNELSLAPMSRRHAMNIRYMAGSVYYIAHTDSNGNHYALAPDERLYSQSTDNQIAAASVTIVDNRIVDALTHWAFDLRENWSGGTLYAYEFSPRPLYNTTFSVNNGEVFPNNTVPNHTGPKFLGFGTGSQVAYEIYMTNDGFTMQCNKNFDGVTGNENYYLMYLPEINGFRHQFKNSVAGGGSLYKLYRISSHVLDLYRAITRMSVYAEGGNSDNRYPAEDYADFLACLQDSIDLYQYYNTSLHEDWDEAKLKEDLREQVDALLNYIDILTLSDTKVSYIDIPVEILDFRADGFMLEYNNNTHGLSAAKTAADALGLQESYLKAATGKWLEFTTADGTVVGATVSQKLTEPTLVKGNMIYGEKTLRQVAYTILAGVATQYNNIPAQNNAMKAKADSLVQKVSGLEVESDEWMKVLGSPQDTYSKTSTPGKNGGELEWKKIETAYDLAYYMLNYLWRPVSSKDDMGDGYTYNVSVPERAVFRLFQDERGLYTLDSYNWVEHTGAYSYNAYPLVETPSHKDSPNFTPIDDLGFEKPGYMGEDNPDTDRGEHLYSQNNYSTKDTNFHFTVHAKGSFVYYEEQNLYFEFLGDDDVYFYINGEIAMDLGGGHSAAGDTLYLNQVASKFGLVDGGVYSFDMFYAERHTSAANLKFSTNMQLMDPDLLTKKSQYDGITGDPLMDGAAVDVGSPVIYSFEMENRGELPVKEVTFHDPSMGVFMSKDKVTIDSTLSKTKLTNLVLTFRSINPSTGKLYDGPISYHKDWTYFKNKLQGHVDGTAPVTGHYTYTVTNDTQLKTILGMGIPANCQFSVYGMERSATEGRYSNTVTSSARPTTLDSNGDYILLTPVYGSATRNVYGINLSGITIPEPLQVVLDYGKPIALPMNDLWTRVNIKDKNMVLDFAGLTLSGENGAIRVKEPLHMFCTSTVEEQSVDSGLFYLDGGVPTFRLQKQMTHEEVVFAIYRISLRDTKEVVGYLMEEIQLLPATMMYYETDFAEGIFTVTSGDSKTLDNSGNTIIATEPNELQDDGTVVPGEAFVKTASEEKDYSHALFFDFSKTPQDKALYSQPQYNGVDYTEQSAWAVVHSSTDVNNMSIDSEAGTLSFNAIKTFPAEGSTSTSNRLDLYNKTDLKYDPTYAEILQVRVKLDDMIGKDNIPFMRLWWEGTIDGKKYRGYENRITFSSSYVSDGTYATYTFDLTSIEDDGGYHTNAEYNGFVDMRSVEVITNIRFSFHNFSVSPASKITYDYLYIGPKNNAPVQHGQNSLYVTFDNTDSDQMRYRYPQYNGLNPDQKGWSTHHYVSSNVSTTGNNETYKPGHTIDHANGTITLGSGQAVEAGKSNNYAFVLSTVNYPVDQAEVFEARIKLVNFTYHSKNKVDLRYKMGTNTSYTTYPVAYSPTESEVEDGEFFTARIPLGEDFRNLGTLSVLRLTLEFFGVTKDSQVIVDYVYLGPDADSPYNQETIYSTPKDDFLYFGFENNEDAQARYTSSVYGGLNFDLLNDGEKLCWDANDSQAKPEVYVDNKTGTIVVTTDADPYIPEKESNSERFYFQTGTRGAHTQPLNYSPENAEICQVRLKFKGFAPRNNGEYPTLQFRSHEDGYVYEEGKDNCTVALSEYIPLDGRFLDADQYITFSAPVLANVNAARLNTFRLDFLDLDWAQNDVPGTITIDYMYIGPKDSAPDPVYGYDSSYEDDTALSNGSSLYIEGQGVKLNENTKEYTRVEFSFTGTGFDVISRTGDKTAALRMELYNEAGEVIKRMSVNTKGELELYQIPVISVQGLEYGTYHVTIDVNKAVDSSLPILSRGNQFFFDAVRIYDPMDTTVDPLVGETLHDTIAHLMDREDRSHVKEIRNILLSANDFAILEGSQVGALFVDSYKKPEVPVVDPETNKPTTATPKDLDISNHYAMDVLTYNKIGPKNEVYLDPGQAVAFKIEVDSGGNPRTLLPISLDVGAKTITGKKAANLVAAVVSKSSKTDDALTIATRTDVSFTTCTALYRPLTVTRNMLVKDGGKYYCYVVLFNNTNAPDEGATGERNGDYVISLTDIKLSYVLDPTPGEEDSLTDPEIKPGVKAPLTPEEAQQVSFVVDGNTTKAAAVVIGSCLETPLLVDGVNLGHSLNLASDISINYVAKKTDLAEYDSFYLECVVEGRKDSLRIDPVEKGNYYYFTLEGLTAVHMANEVTATLHLEKDGRIYYTEADRYSIAKYAYGQLAKETGNAKLKALCAELLRYGSMAQIFKDYRTESLADQAMTQEQKALLTDLSTVTFHRNNQTLSEITNPKATWTGKTLVLDSRVTVRYVVDIAEDVNPKEISLRVRYKDCNGTEKEMILTDPQAYGNTAGRYCFDFAGLLAAELRTVLYAAVLEGQTQISDTLVYSVDTYGANKTGTLGELCKALMAYSDSAKAFFG